jgi:hypothetical protein
MSEETAQTAAGDKMDVAEKKVKLPKKRAVSFADLDEEQKRAEINPINVINGGNGRRPQPRATALEAVVRLCERRSSSRVKKGAKVEVEVEEEVEKPVKSRSRQKATKDANSKGTKKRTIIKRSEELPADPAEDDVADEAAEQNEPAESVEQSEPVEAEVPADPVDEDVAADEDASSSSSVEETVLDRDAEPDVADAMLMEEDPSSAIGKRPAEDDLESRKLQKSDQTDSDSEVE